VPNPLATLATTQGAPDGKESHSVHAETQTEEPLPPIPVPATAAGTQTDELVPAMPKEAEPPALPLFPIVDVNTVPELSPKPVMPQAHAEVHPSGESEADSHDATTTIPQVNNSSIASDVDSTVHGSDPLSQELANVTVALVDATATVATDTTTAAAAVAEESFVGDNNKPETEPSEFDQDRVAQDLNLPSSEGDHKPPSTPIDQGHMSHEHLQESEPHTVPMTTQSAVKRALAARNAHKDLVLKHSSPFRHSSHGHKSLGVDNNYCHSSAPPSPFSFEGGALGRLAWTPSMMHPALATSPTHHRSREGLPRASRTWRSEESARSPDRKWPVASSADAAPSSPASGYGLSATPNRRSMPSPLSRNARVGIAPF